MLSLIKVWVIFVRTGNKLKKTCQQQAEVGSPSYIRNPVWYPGPESNRHGRNVRGILSPLCLPISPPGHFLSHRLANIFFLVTNVSQRPFETCFTSCILWSGGGGRNRTGVDGFAGRCITTLPPRRL